jgi:hypothetical protein
MADDVSNIEYKNRFRDLKCPDRQHITVAPNVSELVWPIWKVQTQFDKVLVMFNAIETRRNTTEKKKLHRMHQWFTSVFIKHDQQCYLEIYHW